MLLLSANGDTMYISIKKRCVSYVDAMSPLHQLSSSLSNYVKNMNPWDSFALVDTIQVGGARELLSLFHVIKKKQQLIVCTCV